MVRCIRNSPPAVFLTELLLLPNLVSTFTLIRQPNYHHASITTFSDRRQQISITKARYDSKSFHSTVTRSQGHRNNQQGDQENKEEDDPWAAYTLHTDDTEDENDDDDDVSSAWLKEFPETKMESEGLRDISPDPSLLSQWKRGAGSASLLNDHFYTSFDEEKFLSMQKEYSANARGMTVAEYEQWEKDTRQSAADAVTGIHTYVRTKDVEKKSQFIESIQQHLLHQRNVFNEMADFFHSPDAIPQNLEPVMRHLMKRTLKQMKESRIEGIERGKKRNRNLATLDEMGEDSMSKSIQTEVMVDTVYNILDVGSGTGALFPYLLEVANDMKIQLNITAVDLSPKMIRLAKEHAENSLDDHRGRHEFHFHTGDFVELIMGKGYDPGPLQLTGYCNGQVNEDTVLHRLKYDAVIFHSCFGNFFNQAAVITAAAECLRPDGILVITHPLGAEFVRKLNAEDPDTVPHHLPTILDFRSLARSQSLLVLDFIEDVDLLDIDKNIQNFIIYYASARKAQFRPLRDIIRLRGRVDKGYGRGGKKLGFPTANLPSSLFTNALDKVPTGVYFGWAVIEDIKGVRSEVRKGRNTWHKAVVNVGYSPTFSGQENQEKIVEAHLIVDDDDIRGDFYNETIRLALSGFLRPEMKFKSFADLIAAISNDVSNAKEGLSLQPFAALRTDKFLTDPCKRINNTMVQSGEVWIGKSGGDEQASWEFEDLTAAIIATPMARWVL